MQRRWAAICLAFFLVTAAGAYGAMAVAEEPEPDLDGETYQDGDTFEANGTTHMVEIEDGSGSIVWEGTVESEESWENESTIEYADGEYSVLVESGEDPEQFALTEEFDVEAILEADDEVENSTYEDEDGNEFVRYTDGSTEPLEEYLPEPNQEVFSEGDSLEHDNETKTVADVSSEEVLVAWEAEEEQSESLAHGENVTVSGTTYVALFQDDGSVQLSEDVEGYQAHTANVEFFEERVSGLMYVIIFSLSTAFLLAILAFIPRRG